MASQRIKALLDRLDRAKQVIGGNTEQIKQILTTLAQEKISDATALIRFHELLLFLRAYPQSPRLLQLVEKELSSFSERVKYLEERGSDTTPLGHPEVSGIAGTSVTDTFSYYIVRWLIKGHPTQVGFYWEWFEDENRLGETLPRFLPLLEEDAAVEANVPFRSWLRAARGRDPEVHWLVKRIESLSLSDKEKAELYDSLQLYVYWTPSYRATRTGMRLPVRDIFYQRESLIERRDVSFAQELEKPLPAMEKLPRKKGEAILDMARETSTIRYRELYGFTHGDPSRVLKTSVGRGVDIFLMGVPPEWRLPLRAYHAAMIFRNGVPVGYFEGLSLFERMESGFNFYYSFREGETAWIYARTLNLFRHLLGVTAFSIDPYQIGYENEEGIESGAFWFYRKLGFRSARPKLLKLTLEEERQIARRHSHRTSPRVLRELATGHMIFELPKSPKGDWDRFQVRNIGLAVQRRMASEFGGYAEGIRSESAKIVSRALGLNPKRLSGAVRVALDNLALPLAMVPNLDRWSAAEKQGLVEIIRAKASPNEARYLKLMQKHSRLRSEMIKLGS